MQCADSSNFEAEPQAIDKEVALIVLGCRIVEDVTTLAGTFRMALLVNGDVSRACRSELTSRCSVALDDLLAGEGPESIADLFVCRQ